MRKKTKILASAAALLGILLSTSLQAATMSIINADAPGEGFNDNSPRDPVGGNIGTTLGEQRLIAFQAAADQVGSRISSGVAITIEASFDPLFCAIGSATLGSAGPNSAEQNFASAPVSNVLYPQALVNALEGDDGQPGLADIGAEFNSSIDNNCLGGGVVWYYGLDGNPPGNEIDLLGTVAHEIIHGLGFISVIDETTGQICCGNPSPGIFDFFIKDLDLNKTWVNMTSTERQNSATNEDRVVWNGPGTTNNAAPTLTAGTAIDNNDGNIAKVLLYTPPIVESGSSVSHWEQDLVPDALMEPAENGYNLLVRKLGIGTCLLQDIGWTLESGITCPDNPDAGPSLTATPTSHNFGTVFVGNTELRNFVLSNTGDQALTITNITVPGGPFAISTTNDSCSNSTIPVGGSPCNFDVTYSPGDTSAHDANITVVSNDPNSPTLLAINGQGDTLPVPSISASPTSHDFGQTAVGSNSNEVITLSNTGTADLVIGTISASGTGFNTQNDICSGRTLTASTNCTLTVRFSPSSTGSATGSISIPSNDTANNPLVVNLSGEGTPPTAPAISTAKTGLDFGQVDLGDSASESVALTNSGDATLTFGQLSANGNGYSLSSDNCSEQSIEPNASCSFIANFSPTETGITNGNVIVPSNADGDADFNISLNGVGVQDKDDIPAGEEAAVPNGEDCAPGTGDANCDNVSDAQQNNVASFRDNNGNFATLITNAGELVNVRVSSNPAPDSTPTDVSFNHGFFSFNIDCDGPCPASVQVTLILDNSNTPNSYFKYGPTPDNITDHFYQLGTGTPGVSINSNVVTLNLVDGGLGDSDLTVDGVITDPGAPATAPAASNNSGGGGGGCTIIRTQQAFDPLLILLLFVSVLMLTVRSRPAQ